MHIVVPFGFYGAGNIGDEATLHGFAKLIAEAGLRPQVSVASRNPAHTALVEPAFRYHRAAGRDLRRWWAMLGASAHAIVGGTPIMDVLGNWPLNEVAPLVRSVDRWKVPLVFIGSGIETLRSDKSRRIVTNDIAPRVQHWTVRSDRDRQRLMECGVLRDRITTAADLAWLIEPVSTGFGRERLRAWGVDEGHPLIGVNLVNENGVFDRQPEMIDTLASALDEICERMDARVVFLANEVREGPMFDKAAAMRVIGRMKSGDRATLTPNEYWSPRQMMSIIGCCSLTLSMRYHFCLFSALQTVPFIAVQRCDKVSDLCWDLDWPARVSPPDLHDTEIVEHGIRLMETSAVSEQLRKRAGRMRDRALLNIAALDALASDQLVASELFRSRP